jgi:kremen protein
MTQRGDPRALFQPVYGCNPDTDALQVELEFIGRQNDVPGGNVCVRTGMGTSYEFRYSPPGNPGTMAIYLDERAASGHILPPC